MYHPDDFDKNDHSEKNQDPAKESEAHAETPKAEPQWYSVSNESGGFWPPVTTVFPEPKHRRGKRVAGIAVLLVLCLLISAVSGFVGAMLLGSESDIFPFDTPTQEDPAEQSPSSTGGEGAPEGIDYPYIDDNYDFAAALSELVKNNDSSLVGSPNGSAGTQKKSLVEVAATVKDSVVEISTTTLSNFGTISAGAGSGVIIHEDGIIVTNNHVIEGSDEIVVRLTNGDTYEAVLRGTDEAGDIALIKISPRADKPLTAARLGNSSALALGEEVVAIGNPFGQLGGTATNGIISALERAVSVEGNVMTLLQTNAAINSGNSGGGLFNMVGELIGVVNAKYAAEGVEGLGFAIPIDTAYESSFKDLLQYGYIRGIPTLNITAYDRVVNGRTGYGAYVYSVSSGSAFRVGDYIYSIDGTVVYGLTTSAVSAVKSIVAKHRVGDTLTVVVKRSNTTVTLSVTLQEYVPDYITGN